MRTFKSFYKRPQFPALITFFEKHDENKKIVYSLEGFKKAALDIVSERLSNGEYQVSPNDNSYERFFENFSGMTLTEFEEVYSKLKDSGAVKIRDVPIDDLKEYLERLHEQATQQNKIIEQAQKAVREQDGKRALNVLDARKNIEYEDYSIETQIVVYN